MTFSHLNESYLSKKNYSATCFGYHHKRCKGFRGHAKEKCECVCHEQANYRNQNKMEEFL